MKNTIKRIEKEDLVSLEKKLSKENYLTVNLDGKNLPTKNKFFEEMKQAFDLTDVYNWAGISDWMRDLSWISNEKIAVIIENYSDFLSQDEESKVIAMEMFEEEILPFWEKDVTRVTVGGKPRVFQVFLEG